MATVLAQSNAEPAHAPLRKRHHRGKRALLQMATIATLTLLTPQLRAQPSQTKRAPRAEQEQPDALEPTVGSTPPSDATVGSDEEEADPRLQALEARIAELEAKDTKESSRKNRALVSIEPGKGFTVTSVDEKYSLNIKSRIQLRYTYAHNPLGTHQNSNEFNVRTLRLSLGGNLFTKDFKYTIQFAFGGNDFDSAINSNSPIFDAFVDYVKNKNLNLRVGQFFVPFDRARTIREFALHFVDRQQVVRELTLDRDIGVMLSSPGVGEHQRFGYHLFIGGGDGRNRFGAQELGTIVVGRIVLRPMGTFDDDQEGDLERKESPKLAVGLGGGYNRNTNRINSTYGTVLTADAVNYIHGAADVVFKWHGFYLLTEGLLRKASSDTISGNVNGVPTTQFTRSGYGYFVQVGQMLSKKTEITARWDQLFAWGDGTDPNLITQVRNQGKQAGAGFNIYLNGHALKIQTDYFYIFGANHDNAQHQARVQLDASF